MELDRRPRLDDEILLEKLLFEDDAVVNDRRRRRLSPSYTSTQSILHENLPHSFTKRRNINFNQCNWDQISVLKHVDRVLKSSLSE